ncbi:MAG: sulfatase [Kiritimatiellia bacterium]
MQKNRPNIITIICHDIGQHLGCYGVPGVRSANIDAFAAGSIRFQNSFCTAPQCSPSRAALWTGRYPHATGVIGLTHGLHANDLNPDEKHLAQILRAAEYETHLFGVQHEAHTPERCGHEFIHRGRICAKIADDFVSFLSGRKNHDRSLLAQIGFFEPHRPFPHEDTAAQSPDKAAIPPYLPDNPSVRRDLAEFEASIASVDKAFGRVMDAIRASPISGNTLILYTADHGIPFPHAKMTLYDPGLQVPLIISMPDGPRGIVRNEMISNVDVTPTLLDILSLPNPNVMHGRSFKGLLTGQAYIPNKTIFGEKTYHIYYDPMRCVRTEKLKLVANFECAPGQEIPPDPINSKCFMDAAGAAETPVYHPPLELYDLESDPHELVNLADRPEHAQTRNELARLLYRWMAETQDPLLRGPVAQGAYYDRMKMFTAIGQA